MRPDHLRKARCRSAAGFRLAETRACVGLLHRGVLWSRQHRCAYEAISGRRNPHCF